MTYTFDHIAEALITKEEALRRARALVRDLPFPMTVQAAIDSVITAAIEHAQSPA